MIPNLVEHLSLVTSDTVLKLPLFLNLYCVKQPVLHFPHQKGVT